MANLLTGNADILTPQEAREIQEGRYSSIDEYVGKGYLIDEEEEARLYRLRYLDFLDKRDASEIQIFFVPTYSCNFMCTYCYQREYIPSRSPLTRAVMDAFFNYIEAEFSNREKYITIFGGEPLLVGEQFRESVRYLLTEAKSRGIECALVTNGYHLVDYISILKQGRIREIQVTLDGIAQVHDRRRRLRHGGKTFHRIVQGIDACLSEGFPVNLRVVLDRENIDGLPAIAQFSHDKGWTKNPLFKTQLGRNYELHSCQADRSRLMSRVGFYEKIYELLLAHPLLVEFHRPAYSLSRFLFDNGEMPDPLFDSCPACKTEWAFDYSGRIYPCTATVGKEDEAVGSFYPEVVKRQRIIDLWEARDVTSIEKCRTCSLQLLCGGGCGSVAKNRGRDILSPDCRPEKELLEMGISLYFEKGIA